MIHRFSSLFVLLFLVLPGNGCSSGTSNPNINTDGMTVGDVVADLEGDLVVDGTVADLPDLAGNDLKPVDGTISDLADSAVDLVPDVLSDTHELPDNLVPDLLEDVADEENVCTPVCVGDCGSDGCGGSCGVCIPPVQCVEGMCVAPPSCKSSKDCEEGVCDKEAGWCVECIEDADCEESQICTAFHECIDVVACLSDKDCSLLNKVCDKEKGFCVDCLSDLDCAQDHHCQDTFCLEDVCNPETQGKSCIGLAVVECLPNGSGWAEVGACKEGQFCKGGGCLDWVCVPGAEGCDGEMAYVCNQEGSMYAQSTDCTLTASVCLDGFCQPVICVDGQQSCKDNGTVATCGLKGTALLEGKCPLGQYCDADKGECVGWVCPPGISLCVGTVARTCNPWGGGGRNRRIVKPPGSSASTVRANHWHVFQMRSGAAIRPLLPLAAVTG